ncbi:hypothetical protein XM25_19770 [Devosia sp. H5989]|nr:hypothetical protein XM25_19770 [Devosia sp. H5989]
MDQRTAEMQLVKAEIKVRLLEVACGRLTSAPAGASEAGGIRAAEILAQMLAEELPNPDLRGLELGRQDVRQAIDMTRQEVVEMIRRLRAAMLMRDGKR